MNGSTVKTTNRSAWNKALLAGGLAALVFPYGLPDYGLWNFVLAALFGGVVFGVTLLFLARHRRK